MQGNTSDYRGIKSVLSLISLSKKANRSVSGEFAVEKAIKEHRAKLVLVADDASLATKKKFSDMATYRHIPFYTVATKEELGMALGRDIRANIAITDEGFAKSIEEKLAFVNDRR